MRRDKVIGTDAGLNHTGGSGMKGDREKDRMKDGMMKRNIKRSAREGIRTPELLLDQPLKLAPLTWLGYSRMKSVLEYLFSSHIKIRIEHPRNRKNPAAD